MALTTLMPIKKIKALKKSDVSYITHGNIIKKHLYRDGLHLNRIGSTIIAENVLFFLSGGIDFLTIRLEIKA